MKQNHRLQALSLFLLVLVLILAACGSAVPVPKEEAAGEEKKTELTEGSSGELPSTPALAVADASQMTTVEEVVEDGMVPVSGESLRDGDYPVEVKSSSSMFRIETAVLHVKGGRMEATLTMSGKSYLYVYPGTATEAANSEENARIPYVEALDGAYTFTIPVRALDEGFSCAAFSKNKELWYDRTLLVRAGSLPREAFRDGFFVTVDALGLPDGDYTVAVKLSGGSGRAQLVSPAELAVRNGQANALIVWSSSNYDYMKADGEMIQPLENTETSSFWIPIPYFDRPIAVIADTVAMSEPHEISYTLLFDSGTIEARS